jgi:carotenoid cleavage dioxygenase
MTPPSSPSSLQQATDWATRFSSALAHTPWLHAYGELPPALEAMACEELPITGRLPAGLTGVLWRILAVRHEVAGLRYHHWWDGDGMLAEYSIEAGRISHRARCIETRKLHTERRAGRLVYEQFGTRLPQLVRPVDLDDMNPANVNVLWHGGELLALGDWCSPWRIDPQTLQGLGPKVWSDDTVGAPFSAHPRADADGVLWSIGYAPWKGVLYLYAIGADGQTLKTAALRLPPFGLVHDFIVTEHTLIVPLTSTVWSKEHDAAGHSMLDCLVFDPGLPVRVLLIDKSDLTIRRTVELPPGMVYHYGNGYALPDGTLRFHCCWFGDASYMQSTFRAVMHGALEMGPPPLQMMVTIAPHGPAQMQPVGGIGELPRVDERYMARPFRHVWLGAPGDGPPGPPTQFGFSALARLDLETGAVDQHHFGPGFIVEEPAFAPRPGSTVEGDGWMVGTVYDIAQRCTRLVVFDALHLADGPLASAALPYAQPIGVHGNFYPQPRLS